MSVKLNMYGPGRITDPNNWDLLTRKRKDRWNLLTRELVDEAYLINRLVYSVTWPEVHQAIRLARPELDFVNATDLSFVKCVTSSGYWSGWQPFDEYRASVDPDAFMARIYRDQYGRNWDHFWADSRGKWISPQANDIVADPVGAQFLGPYDGRRPLAVWAEVYADYQKRGIYDGFSIDMTPGRLTWGIWDDYLDDRQWLDELAIFARAMNLAGVRWTENSWGAGPRNTKLATGYQLERWGNQYGAVSRYGLWGYLTQWDISLQFRDGSIGRWKSGLSTLSETQRRESNLDLGPEAQWTSLQKFEWVKLGLAAAHLMDVGSVSCNRYWRAEDGLWDPHSEFPDEIELWTRLEPVSSTEWRRGTRVLYRGTALPDASTLQDSGIVGVRLMVDPIGGQRYTIFLNPNDHHAGAVDARSARLVRSGTSGSGVSRAGER
jgi:hypothetical protein